MKTTIQLFLILFFMLNFSVAGIINIPGDYPTIQAGIDSAQAGDTVLVANGTYIENIDFHGKKLLLTSNYFFSKDRMDIVNTIIDGNADSSTVSIQSNEPEGTMLVGFTIQNGLGTGNWPNVRGGGVHISGGANPTIKHCIIHSNESVGNSNRGAGIYANSDFAYISNCEVFNNVAQTGGGIMIGNGANGTVVDSCNVYGNDTYSALTIAYSQFIKINRTLVHHNSRVGLRNFATDSVTVTHSVIANNGDKGVSNESNASQVYLVNSFVGFNAAENIAFDTSRAGNMVLAEFSNIIGGRDTLYFGTGCIDTLPEFADTSAYDYSLLSTSAMIDAGDPALPYDPDGTVADIGTHFFSQGPNAVEFESAEVRSFELNQNYPNPFNPSTTIEFTIPKSDFVTLKIYNMLGQEVASLITEDLVQGNYKYTWETFGLASGVYYYKLETKNFAATKKMIVLK